MHGQWESGRVACMHGGWGACMGSGRVVYVHGQWESGRAACRQQEGGRVMCMHVWQACVVGNVHACIHGRDVGVSGFVPRNTPLQPTTLLLS